MLLATLLAAAAWTAPAAARAARLRRHGVRGVRRERGRRASSRRRPRSRGAAATGSPVHADHRRGSAARRSGRPGSPTTARRSSSTVRRHRPTQRIRATIVAPDGTRAARAHDLRPRRIRPPGRSSRSPPTAPRSPPGPGTTARAGACRRRSGARGSRASTVRRTSRRRSADLSRWLWIDVAAGVGGHVALTWYYGGADGLAVRALRLRSAGPDGRFTADQALPGKGGFYDVALAVGPRGAVQLAYSAQRLRRARPARRPCARRAARPAARLPAPACSRAAGGE